MRRESVSIMMEEFAQSLARVDDLKKRDQWREVAEIVGKKLKQLLGTNPTALAKGTETALMAQLVRKGPTYLVPYKLVVLVALLKEAGDFATAEFPPAGGHGWYLKALHVLLDAQHCNEICEYSALIPSVEVLLNALEDTRLPVRTHLLLLRDYERKGCFSKARDEFLAAQKKAPENSKLSSLGIAFFERLKAKTDSALVAGDLPRLEVNAALAKLTAKKI